MQLIQFSAVQRGELAQLRQAEALDTAPRLAGDTMLAGFYIGELLLRLAPRHDPVPELYACYAQARRHLASDLPLAWGLRRFERDVLEGWGSLSICSTTARGNRSTRQHDIGWIRRTAPCAC